MNDFKYVILVLFILLFYIETPAQILENVLKTYEKNAIVYFLNKCLIKYICIWKAIFNQNCASVPKNLAFIISHSACLSQ